VVFSPTTPGAVNGTLTINSSDAAADAATDKLVALSGTGIAPVIAAALTPTSRNFGTVTRGTLGPIQVFTLTNTGNVTLTGITQGVLGGANPADYAKIAALSTCGPAGGGQFLGRTTLAPGATCAITVQFRPLATDPANSVRNATVSVTDAAGTQTSTLTGTAR
jgi:hypothetical protein